MSFDLREGESLDPLDLEAFYRWMESSYEALEFDPVQQEVRRLLPFVGWLCIYEDLYWGMVAQAITV